MDDELHLSKEDYGLASGAFFIGYGVLQVPCTHVAPLLGANRVIGVAMLAASSSSMAMGWAGGNGAVLILRALLGLTEAAVAPVTMVYISRNFPESAVAPAVALWGTSSAVGYAVSSMTSGALVRAFDGVSGFPGWRWLFWLQAVPGVLAGLLILGCLHPRPADASWLPPEEAAALHASVRRARPSIGLRTALGRTLCAPLTWVYSVKVFLDCVMMYSVVFFLPMQVQEAFPALTEASTSLVCAIPPMVILLVSPPWAALTGKSNTRRFAAAWAGPLASSLALLAASWGMLFWRNDAGAVAVIGLLMLSYVLVLCSTGPFMALVNSVSPVTLLPCTVALSNALGHIGGFLGPFVLGALHGVLHGPPCRAPTHGHGCVAEWGAGTAVIAAVSLLLAGFSGVAAWRCIWPRGHATDTSGAINHPLHNHEGS